MTIGEIEGLRGILSPHEKELKDICARGLPVLKSLTASQLLSLSTKIGASVTSIGLNEEWSLTKQFFPGVMVHLGLRQYPDEFGDGASEELFVVFSGDIVRLIPGEDLASYVELFVEYLGLTLENSPKRHAPSWNPSPMLLKSFHERGVAIPLLVRRDYRSLQDFIGGTVPSSTPSATIEINTLPFPQIEIDIRWDPGQGLSAAFGGEHASLMSQFDLERLSILTLNHVLRHILIFKGAPRCPRICWQMFTPYGREKYQIPH